MRTCFVFFTKVQNLTQSPMSIITKSAPILSEDSFVDMLPVAWELLLENDQELAAAAGKYSEWPPILYSKPPYLQSSSL